MKLKNLGKLDAQWYVLLVALLAYMILYFADKDLFGSTLHFFLEGSWGHDTNHGSRIRTYFCFECIHEGGDYL